MLRARVLAFLSVLLTALLMGTTLAGPAEAKRKPPKPVTTPVTGHLLSFNDFHGQIDPPSGSSGLVNGVPAGGVEYLAHYVKQRRAAAKADGATVYTVAAGDLVGASPLVSAAFHDEPAVEEMNALGLDVTSVGNHEFDEGVTEVLRLQRGGCHPTDGCQDGDGFEGADYPMLAANVVRKKNNLPILPPFTVKKVGKVPVAFVGMTLEGTPGIVNPAGIKDVKFLDEARTANFYAKVLRAFGIRSLVLLIHEGGVQAAPPAPVDPNGCANFSGAIGGIVSKLDPAYGIVVSGHTHAPYNCQLPNSSGKKSLVTSAGSVGTQLTDITFRVDPRTGRFVSASALNTINANGVQNSDGTWQQSVPGIFVRDPAKVDPAAKVVADKYRAAVAPIANRVVGSVTADITRLAAANGESSLGDVIADGMLAYTSGAGAQIALMNPGGIRADLPYGSSPGGEEPGQVTYGEAFTVQPFNNLVATQTYTGVQLEEVLEQQFAGYAGQTTTRILQVSAGFSYSYDTTQPLGSRVSAMALNGVPIDPATTYRVTMNDFLANGGDGFSLLSAGTDRATAPGFDVDSLTAYLGAGAVAPGPVNRITKIA